MASVIIDGKGEVPTSNDLSTRKRKEAELDVSGDASNACITSITTTEPPAKVSKTTGNDVEAKKEDMIAMRTYAPSSSLTAAQRKARETRLEQNRKAARESRRRKKIMIEDLQKSVIFFSRANGALKHQNDELTRLLMQAQAQVSVIESASSSANAASRAPQLQAPAQEQPNTTESSSKATTPPPSSAVPATAPVSMPHVAAPPTYIAPPTTYPSFPVMQPGATMQAMASFQQAAAAAMQVAVQGMQGISPEVIAQPSPSTGSSSAQQVYNDTMTALAMQQAAAAAACVPPNLMAQFVGSTASAPTNTSGWATVGPTTIMPASVKSTTKAAPVPLAPANGPVPVAPKPAPSLIVPQQQHGTIAAATGERI